MKDPVRLNASIVRDYIRAARCRYKAGYDSDQAGNLAVNLYGPGSQASLIARGMFTPGVNDWLTKAAVGGTELADTPVVGADPVSVQVFNIVLEPSIPGLLTALRRVPFNVRLISAASGATGYWVGESKAVPISRGVLNGSSLPRRKVAAIVVTTREAVDALGSAAESRQEIDLRRAVLLALDQSFIDPSNSGSSSMPAAVTNGAPTFTSTGDPRQDLKELSEHFDGDLDSAMIVMHPDTAVEYALVEDSSGSLIFPNIGPRGGSLLGIPVITSRAVPGDTSGKVVALIDGSGIAFAQEGGTLGLTDEAVIEMSDAPQGAADTPTAASATPVALFNTDALAYKIIVHTNWERQRSGCLSVVTGVSY